MERRLLARDLGKFLLPLGMIVAGILAWTGYLTRSGFTVVLLLLAIVSAIQAYRTYQRLYGD